MPTLTGSVKMKVPPGTQSGRLFRLKGQGIQSHSSYSRGDQIVRTVVVIPSKLSHEEAELYKRLREFDLKRDLKPGKSFLSKMKGYFS